MLFVLDLFLAPVATKAQLDPSDSLIQKWNNDALPKEERCGALEDYILDRFFPAHPDSIDKYALLLSQFAEENQYPKARGIALGLQVLQPLFKTDYPTALEIAQESLSIFEGLADTLRMIKTYSLIADVYGYYFDFENALSYNDRQMLLAEQTGDLKLLAKAHFNRATLHISQQEFAQSIIQYKKVLEIYRKDSVGGTALSDVYSNLAYVYQYQGDFQEAINYSLKALAIDDSLGDMAGKSTTLTVLGQTYFQAQDLQKAIHYFEDALELKIERGDPSGTIYAMGFIGLCYSQLQDYTKAADYCRRALEISLEEGLKSDEIDCRHCLYEAYKAQGDFAQALQQHEKLMSLSDSIFNADNTKQLTQIEMQYAFDKEKALEQAEQEKKDALAEQALERQKLQGRMLSIGLGVVLLFAILFLLQRNRIRKGKAESDFLLLNILPSETAEELKVKGSAESRLVESTSVLFTDFEGFTALSEQLSPQQLVSKINDCFSAFDQIMEERGVEKIKTIGDAYMAAGGLPKPNGSHAKDVVLAALDIRDYMQATSEAMERRGEAYFKVRIGINTGPVVAGIVGLKKFQYDIWGDTVNMASRMESSGAVGRVNISASTFAQIKDDPEFSFEPRGKLEVKGKGLVEMYFVERKER